jgi:hypothetical protein
MKLSSRSRRRGLQGLNGGQGDKRYEFDAVIADTARLARGHRLLPLAIRRTAGRAGPWDAAARVMRAWTAPECVARSAAGARLRIERDPASNAMEWTAFQNRRAAIQKVCRDVQLGNDNCSPCTRLWPAPAF